MDLWTIGFFLASSLLALGMATSQIATMILTKGTPARLAALSFVLLLAGVGLLAQAAFSSSHGRGQSFDTGLALALLSLIPLCLRHSYWPGTHNWINLPASIGIICFVTFCAATLLFS